MTEHCSSCHPFQETDEVNQSRGWRRGGLAAPVHCETQCIKKKGYGGKEFQTNTRKTNGTDVPM